MLKPCFDGSKVRIKVTPSNKRDKKAAKVTEELLNDYIQNNWTEFITRVFVAATQKADDKFYGIGGTD